MANNKRSFKFYRENEKDVMSALGMKGTANSGSGWIEKEDGQNDYLICQLKSTDAVSIKLIQKDLRVLEYNAATTHKIPMFAIQFLNTREVWLMVKPLDIVEAAKFIETGKCEIGSLAMDGLDISAISDIDAPLPKEVILSDEDARKQFYADREENYNKEKKKRW